MWVKRKVCGPACRRWPRNGNPELEVVVLQGNLLKGEGHAPA